jgi:uncharacterized protein (DUF1330 family)
MTVKPTKEQIEALKSGKESYKHYSDAAIKMVQSTGGKLVWIGKPWTVLIGTESDEWDLVAIVEYPSREAFLEMTSRPKYKEAAGDRTAAIERSALIPTKPGRID